MKRFKVISIYTDCVCNKNPPCEGCYVQKYMKDNRLKRKPDEFWFELVPYLKQLTNQIAFASFEPLLFPKFMRKFSALCVENGLICNITSNGILTRKIPKEAYEHITMVSLSLDKNKQGTEKEKGHIIY